MLTSPDKPPPTEEQVAMVYALTQTEDHLLGNALAGTGKTSAIKLMLNNCKTITQLYLAFNKANVKEALVEQELGEIPSTTRIQTFNSLGHRAWGQATGKKLVIDSKMPKMPTILKSIIGELKGDDRDEAWERYGEILKACSMAKHLGYIPNVPGGRFPTARPLTDREGLETRLEDKFSPFCWSLIDAALVASIKAAYDGGIDYDDQIYMSALFGGTFPRFPIVFVDECQDLSPTNHAMLAKMRESRMVAVGDRWQAIYGFRGAETDGVDKLKSKYNMKEFPLSISFRCPENVVKAVHWHVPHMKWFKSGGIYETLHNFDPDTIPDGAAIVCRNNAPLFRAAFALLSRKRSVSVAGSDIGPKIIRLLGKIGEPRDNRKDLLFKIEAWKDAQLEKTNAPATVNDTYECLKIFATWGNDCAQAINYANWILAQHGSIELTTGHKAKGLEWETVYHLDKSLLKVEGQDPNLKYVITTRAGQNLYEITSEQLTWQ